MRTPTRWCCIIQPERVSSALPGWVESGVVFTVVFPSDQIALCFAMVSVWNQGGYKSNNNRRMPSFLKPNCNPEEIFLHSGSAYMYHTCVRETACFSPRQRLQMASFYGIALFPLPLVMKNENHAMLSFVLIGDFFFFLILVLIWVALSVSFLSVACYLSLRAFEQASFMLLSSRWRDGDKNLN